MIPDARGRAGRRPRSRTASSRGREWACARRRSSSRGSAACPRPAPPRMGRRGVRGRRGRLRAGVPGGNARPRGHGPGAARGVDPGVRLVVRSAGLAARDRRPAALERRRRAGEPGAPGPSDRPPAHRLLGGRRAHDPVRGRLRPRGLRHDAVLDAHGPAPAADARRGRRSYCSPDRSPCCCRPRRPRSAAAGSCRSCTRRWSGACPSPSSRGSCSRPSCGRATSRRCSTSPSRTSGPHRLEHALFIVAALLFWWPVIGPDPSPWKLKPSARILYTGLAMPQNTFLALAIYMASAPLYAGLHHDQPDLGPHAARGPAGRGRDHVGRRRHPVRLGPGRDDLAVDRRRAAGPPRRPPARRSGRRSASARCGSPRDARRSVRIGHGDGRTARLIEASGGIGAWRYSR